MLYRLWLRASGLWEHGRGRGEPVDVRVNVEQPAYNVHLALPVLLLRQPPRTRPPPPPRRQTATPPEESGEWVEAMYDYSSEVCSGVWIACGADVQYLRCLGPRRPGHPGGDADPRGREDIRRLVSVVRLSVEARILTHVSYVRWTGEANGRRGLIPAAYVKVL